MANFDYDVVVIGGGPGGYVCAIRAAQLGKKVACIDIRERMGGTCLNVGCIPSKALLDSSEKYHEAKEHFANQGVIVSKIDVDFPRMMQFKKEVLDQNGKGIDMLFAKNKVKKITGYATITGKNEISVKAKEGKAEKITAANIVIATGSEVASLPNIKIDEKDIISSTGALELKEVPKSMVVIGGGYIGLELGSVYKRLGTEVTVVEFLDRLVPAMDSEISRQFHKILEKQGMKFKLATKVVSASVNGKKVDLVMEPAAGGEKEKISVDKVLVAVGRRPFTDGLGLRELGVKMTDRGVVEIDDHFRTNIPNIYAIGDVVRGAMLAHKAEEEGVAVAEIIDGQAGHVNYHTIPGVVYTSPEVASVGFTEEQVKEQGIKYNVGKFPFMANSRARAIGSTDGLVKIIACAETDKILGAHIIGPDAGTIIAELVVGMEYSAAAEDISRISHAHPTLNEAVKEAALAVAKRSIHS